MTKLAVAVSLALSGLPLADLDSQPACRQACEERYAAELAECQAARTEREADGCRDAAQDRHQECIDRCND